MSNATYTKLQSGDWGIRVPGEAVVGQCVIVKKRDGSTRTETVSQIIWSGNGVTICAIRKKFTPHSSARSSSFRRRGYGPGRCRECGEYLERWMDGYAMGLCHDCL